MPIGPACEKCLNFCHFHFLFHRRRVNSRIPPSRAPFTPGATLLNIKLQNRMYLRIFCLNMIAFQKFPWFVSDTTRQDIDWIIGQLQFNKDWRLAKIGERWKHRFNGVSKSTIFLFIQCCILHAKKTNKKLYKRRKAIINFHNQYHSLFRVTSNLPLIRSGHSLQPLAG